MVGEPIPGRDPVAPGRCGREGVRGIVGRVRAAAADRPHEVAVAGTVAELTYRELCSEAEVWAGRLHTMRLPERSVVALLVHSPVRLPVLLLAVWAAELVPLLVDPLLPEARRRAMLTAARAALVVEVSTTPALRAGSPDPRVLQADAGYMVFSSGSQGAPKGIVGHGGGLLHFLDWEIDTLGPGHGWQVAALTSPSFDVVFRELLLPLFTGGTLHVADAQVRADPARVLRWLADRHVEVVHLVPTLAARWVAASPGWRLEHLRWALFAGEPLYATHVAGWRSVAPRSAILNLYGPSETTLAKFWHQVPDPPDPGVQPVGQPLPGTVLRTMPLTADEQAPAASQPDGFRVAIETRYGSLGYLDGTVNDGDHARLTHRAGVTRFLTQDRGHLLADGTLVIDGRLDSSVKRRGVLLDLARLEGVALGSAGVHAACGVQVGADAAGEVVLAVETGADFSTSALRSRLRRLLGPQAPDDVAVMPALPVLPNGKVDRRRVAGMLSGSGA